jgi:antitoxin component YwqK of YwqJK toxin-antitoxin module
MRTEGSVALGSARPIRRWLALTGMLMVALAGLVLFKLAQRGNPAPALAEVSVTELELRDGRWCWRGQDQALTGWLVEFYTGGGLRSRSLVSNGWLEGVSAGWHTNGVKQVEEHFRAGVSHGRRLKWNLDGSKLSEAEVVDGQLEGTFRRWHPDGTLAEEIHLKAGQPDGVSRAWFPSGFLKAEARLEQGKVVQQQFWADGERRG